MFTGIVEATGTVVAITSGEKSSRITIRAEKITEDIRPGDSVNTNGVCLTVVEIAGDRFTVDVMPETMRMTTLKELNAGRLANLERALRLGDRLGGHLVSGHVDGTGRILNRRSEDNAVWFTIQAEPSIMKYIAAKGSVTIDGISLTVVRAGQRDFEVSVIPHTRNITTLSGRKPGDRVNIECDLIAKYVEKLLHPAGSGTMTIEKLKEEGFL